MALRSFAMSVSLWLYSMQASVQAAAPEAHVTPPAPSNQRSVPQPLRRAPLFLGEATLAAWAKAAPELFTRPEVGTVIARPGQLASAQPAVLVQIRSGNFQVLHVQPDHLRDGAGALERTRNTVKMVAGAAREAGMSVVLARPLSFRARTSEDDETLAQWMRAEALANGYQYADYRNIDFHPELKIENPSQLGVATSTLRGALDAAFRAAPGVRSDDQWQASNAQHNAIPDGPGSGPFPAIHGLEPGLPGAIVYRPANLALFEKRPLPVVVFANGGCMADANSSRLLLTEIASHGYVVIVPGAMLDGPGGLRAYPDLITVPPDVPGRGVAPADMFRMLDWITAQDAQSSDWGRYIDDDRIAAAGWSCGGLLAIAVSPDPRVKATIVFNSGLFPSAAAGMPGLDVSMSILRELHAPILFLLGGVTDVAFGNGSDTFSRIDHVPAIFMSRDVGHAGTFWEPNGGAWAVVATRWLDWWLKNDKAAARGFVGPACELCRDSDWSIVRNRRVSPP